MAKDEPEQDEANDESAASGSHAAPPEDAPEAAPEPEDASEAAPAPTSSDTEPREEAGAASEPVKPAASGGRASRLWWALPVLLVVELYVYGHDGRVEICVGKEGETDFSLMGQERTDENRWKFPRCETRDNLGLRSQRDARVEEATTAACRGATIFRHQGEAKACVAQEQGWQHHVEGRFVPPWDPAYYRHLFWFFY